MMGRRWVISNRQRNFTLPVYGLVVAAGMMISAAGCGMSAGPSRSEISANTAATDGLAALASKDWQKAEELLTKAINSQSLGPDQYEEVMLGRVRARLELGEHTKAADDLTPLEFQAAAMDQVWLLKCELALRENQMEIAKEAYANGLKVNPKLPKPEGLP